MSTKSNTENNNLNFQFIRNSSIRTKKGITLIALVITIVILLVLSGVVIATLTGKN